MTSTSDEEDVYVDVESLPGPSSRTDEEYERLKEKEDIKQRRLKKLKKQATKETEQLKAYNRMLRMTMKAEDSKAERLYQQQEEKNENELRRLNSKRALQQIDDIKKYSRNPYKLYLQQDEKFAKHQEKLRQEEMRLNEKRQRTQQNYFPI